MDKATENFYKYLLFFKKYAKNGIKTESQDGLVVNPAVEIILYSEKKIRDFDSIEKGVLRTSAVRERDYYEKFSFKKSLEEYSKEYKSLSPVFKKRIENYNPLLNEKIVNKDGKINENFLFFLLINNEQILSYKDIEGIFGRYKKYKTKMSYSFFKSLFCLKNENLEKLLFDDISGGYFSFLFNPVYEERKKIKQTDKIIVNYFSKMFFHLKNQFFNLHFSNGSTIDKLYRTFALDFFKNSKEKPYFYNRLTQPNIFFPDLSIMDKKYLKNEDYDSDLTIFAMINEDYISNLPVFRFMMQRYYYIGAKNLNSILYLMYFSSNEIIKMFSPEKIKKDFGNYIRIYLKKSRPSMEDIKNLEKELLAEKRKAVAKIDDINIKKIFLKKEKESVKGKTFIPYIGPVEYERKKIEDNVKAFIGFYKEEKNIKDFFSDEDEADNSSLYRLEDAQILSSYSLTSLVLEFKDIINSLQKKQPNKEIER